MKVSLIGRSEVKVILLKSDFQMEKQHSLEKIELIQKMNEAQLRLLLQLTIDSTMQDCHSQENNYPVAKTTYSESKTF